MSATTFDTLQFDKELKKGGFNEAQAEALTNALAKVVANEEIVTKSDLKVQLAELKTELIKWVLGVSLAQTGIILSCIKLMH
jgi:hypothetical protein